MSAGDVEYKAQRDALVASALLVPKVGIVHNRPRYGDAAKHWITVIDGKSQIRAWEIGLADPGARVERTTNAHRHRWRTWELRGYVDLVDGSEEDGSIASPSYDMINELAYKIADQWDLDDTHAGTFLDSDPAQIGETMVVGPLGGGFLCWGVTLSLTGYTVVSP